MTYCSNDHSQTNELCQQPAERMFTSDASTIVKHSKSHFFSQTEFFAVNKPLKESAFQSFLSWKLSLYQQANETEPSTSYTAFKFLHKLASLSNYYPPTYYNVPANKVT